MKKTVLIFMVLSGLIFARTDAVVVGVGKYPNLRKDLQLHGVPIDVKNIQTILDAVHVPKKHITVLQDAQATRKRVRKAFTDYINSSKNREGNIFIFYFSGHGLQVKDLDGDEGDGQDEVTVLYDYKVTKKNVITQGVLLDDELYTLLTQIKSKKVLIFDKCHAGSSYRGFVVDFEKVVKGKFTLSKEFAKRIDSFPKAENPLLANVVLSATKDKETAEDSPLGGLFTKSLLEGIVYNKAVNRKGIITLKSLQNFCDLNILESAIFIKKNYKGYDELKGAFHPHFRPNKYTNIVDVFNSNIKQSKPSSISSKPKQKKYLLEDMLDSMVSRKIMTTTLTTPQKNFGLYQNVYFDINSKKKGYINVLIAYKNSYKLFMKNRPISANKTYPFPTSFLKQSLETAKPFGLTKVYTILSTKPWDIERNIRNLGVDKTDDMALSRALSKELIPSIEYDINQKMKKLKEKKRVVKVKPNILTISKVEFNVTR